MIRGNRKAAGSSQEHKVGYDYKHVKVAGQQVAANQLRPLHPVVQARVVAMA